MAITRGSLLGLGLLAAAACGGGSDSKGPVRNNQPAATAADSGSGEAPIGSTDGPAIENPTALLPPPPAANSGGSGGAAGKSDAGAADGCEPGKFCKNTVPDPTDCGKLELKTNVKIIDKPGNIMVVFDRSSSMEADWGGMPKYQAAGNALLSAITPLAKLLTIGGIFFPSAPTAAAPTPECPMGCNPMDFTHFIPGAPGCCLTNLPGMACEVHPIDQPDQINFSPADTFIMGLPTQWHVQDANGTPLEAGVVQAAAAIKGHMFTEPLLVLIMTDGEPNCGTMTMNVTNQITEWKNAGITTHVVGLPGAQGAADLLNQMAMLGGSDKYIDPKDPAELETRLRAVVNSTVSKGFESCTFQLDPKADVPDKLHLIVTQDGKESDVARNLSKDAHWSINAAGDQVDLEGQLCDMAKDGTFESIRFIFGCKDLPPPLDPPPPPKLN